MPIDPRLLQPVEAPQPFNFAALQQSLDRGNAMRTNEAVGQQAAGGDYQGAQAAALKAGNPQLAGQMFDMGNAEHAAAAKAGVQALMQATDPSTWNQYRAKIIQANGKDIGPFEKRDAIIKSAVDALNPEAAATRNQAQANTDRTFGFQQSEANRAQGNADRTYTLAAEKARNGGGEDKYGLNPILGKDPQGNIVVMQPSAAGGLKVATTPDGVSVLGPGDKAYDTTTGKANATNAVNLPTVENAADRLVKGIDSVLDDPGLKGVTGGLQGRLPNFMKFGEASRAQSKIDKVQAGTFLQAYNDIKGAGAITEAEGAKATAAYNRLAHQEMDDKDYRDALIEFKTEVLKLADIARQKAGRRSQPGAAANPDKYGRVSQPGADQGGALPGGTYNWTPDGGLSR